MCGIAAIALLSTVTFSAVQPQTSRNAPTGYANAPFELGSNYVSGNYAGHDLKVLFKTLGKTRLHKGAFESSNDFNVRLEKQQDRIVFGSVRFNSLVAVKISSETAYNADTEVMRISFGLHLVESPDGILRGWTGNDMVVPTGIASVQRLGSYEAQNDFGKAVLVGKSERTEYALSFTNLLEWQLDIGNQVKTSYKDDPNLGQIILKCKVPRSEAPTVKNALRVLAVFRPVYPFVDQMKVRHEPTVSEPSDSKTIWNLVKADIRSFVLYDVHTGKIYGKIVPEPLSHIESR